MTDQSYSSRRRSILVYVLLLAVVVCPSLAFQRFTFRSAASTTTRLFYRNNVTLTEIPIPQLNSHGKETSSVASNQEDDDDYYFASVKREIDRRNLHPLFKLIPEQPLWTILVKAVLFSPILLPLLPLWIGVRKAQWRQRVVASQAKHRAQFQATLTAYRQAQFELVNRLLEAQKLSKTLTTRTTHPRVIAVTMATGQEGQGVVRSLVEEFANDDSNVQILALCRNPRSESAQALQRLDPKRVTLVPCDSTNATSLQEALTLHSAVPTQALYLCTTLNQASAGRWQMQYDGGGHYEVAQGQALATACQQSDVLRASLQQVVYGTAPLPKWPQSSFAIEPPIHYAAKWRIEDILRAAGLPLTCLRKCPYHENFTKLVQTAGPKNVAAMGVQGGGAFDSVESVNNNDVNNHNDDENPKKRTRKIELPPGTYRIKALTAADSDFVYNMMDPRDTGKWAAVAFRHANLLVGQSLSIASDALTGPEMARVATQCGALGAGVKFEYAAQPRWIFELLAWLEPTFVYISGLQRWNCDGGVYDLDAKGVNHVRKLVTNSSTWSDHLHREGLGQFTETMADLLPDIVKRF